MSSTKHFLSYFLLSVLLVTSFACEDDSPNDPVRGDIIVTNEGSFPGGGSVSLIERETGNVQNNVFAKANEDRALNANLQSITINGDQAYLICNATDKIEIVDAETLKNQRTPLADEDLVTPRYMAIVGNKAYVSVWGPYDENYHLPESKIAIINLEDFTIVKYLDTESGPEDVEAIGNKVFVANNYTNQLTVINTDTDEIEEVITLKGSPRWLAVHEDHLWVSVTGTASQFVRINPDDNSIEGSMDVAGTNSNGKFAINETLDMLYFIGEEPWPATETAIYTLPIDEASATPEVLVSGDNFYAIGSDPVTNNIFVGNSNSFQGEGTILQYDAEGTLLDTHAVGVGPNGFVF